MLIVTRKAVEALEIGDDVAVTVIDIRRGHVGPGIKSPQGICVDRAEIGVQVDAGRGHAGRPGE